MRLTKKGKGLITLLLSLFMFLGFSYYPTNIVMAKSVDYKITEEGENVDLPNTPISSFWFPKDLLEWSSKEDKDLNYNKSVVPLANRVDKENLYPVNITQNKDTNVVAISIMNASTSGNPSQGYNKFSANTFSYWQYIDKLVYWGGSAGEGIIVPPSPDVTDSAHKNGVKVLGTVFFPMTVHGGKIEWLNEFLQKDDTGNFPMVDKLIEVSKLYNFDGWFINQETETANKNHAELMQEFIKVFKEKSKNTLEIMWYDSMTKDGIMDWQNALTDKNKYFLINDDNEAIADSMFLNFWWSSRYNIEKELLKNSNIKAKELGLNPYHLYAGVDMQANGTSTPVEWKLFESANNKTYTSLGLYCPSWTYFSSSSVEEFEDKENKLWVNELGNPSMDSKVSGKSWPGISKYVIERTSVSTLPFISNFNIGNGYNFFINGELVSKLDWNNRSLADVIPTYRWIIDNEGKSNLKANLDFTTAYYGGNSIKLEGNLEKNKKSTIKLYSSDIKVDKKISCTTTAKSNHSIKLDLVLDFQDGSKEIIEGNQNVNKEWTTITYDISKFNNKRIKSIGYSLESNENLDDIKINLGNITIDNEKSRPTINVNKLKVEDITFVEDDMFTGVRLSWNNKDIKAVKQYEIYRINEDNSRSFLGATLNNNFYINSLKREGNLQKSTFEVIAINKSNVRGNGDKVEIQWPDNSLPKANFKASKTLVAPNEEITFINCSNLVTTELEWKFEGANIETSTEENPVVKYPKEGLYTVSLKAKNDKGEDIKVLEEFITVTNNAANGLKNLALGKKVTASSFVNPNEAPEFAIDNRIDTKWCAIGSDIHNITIDIGEPKLISELYISHAEVGGESQSMNTKEYSLETSLDGVNFIPVVEVTKNSLGKTIDTFKATKARFVRLNIIKATQGADSAARIYEIEIYGIE